MLTASASRLGGGVASAVYTHTALLQNAGAKVTVVALEDVHSNEDRHALGSAELVTAPVVGPPMVGYAPTLVDKLLATEADVLHLHGIWMYPSRASTQWARKTGRPYLISPHGMLDPWITARGRWKKALARAGYERASWHRSDALHALTEDEAADIRREAGDGRIVVIPNAGPPATGTPHQPRRPAVVYLGRIHPKKNLGALIQGWILADRPDGAELLIAGWGDDGDVSEFKTQLAGAPESVRFLGPAHGEAKQRLLDEARFVILPSHSEGLPMTMLEAWAAGAPTIMTAACHLPEGFAAGAAIECGTDPASIAAALGDGLRLGEADWGRMSAAGLALARGPFSAEQVSSQWADTYRELADGTRR